ncbi:MAG: hypothetical protein ABTQ26_05555 [Azonexus sp.]
MRRPSTLAFMMLALLGVLVVLIFAHSWQLTVTDQSRLLANRALVTQLGLTDLSLFSESRYTRHPSQADLHSALQDHPGAFDHFPTGSLISPPAHLNKPHERLAGKTKSPD